MNSRYLTGAIVLLLAFCFIASASLMAGSENESDDAEVILASGDSYDFGVVDRDPDLGTITLNPSSNKVTLHMQPTFFMSLISVESPSWLKGSVSNGIITLTGTYPSYDSYNVAVKVRLTQMEITYTFVMNIQEPGGSASCTATFTHGVSSGTMPHGTVSPITKQSGETIHLPTSGYTFSGYLQKGWRLNSVSGPFYELGASYTLSSDVKFYAVWEAEEHTISFNANGGTGSVDPITADSHTQVTLPSSGFSRSGWVFGGWNSSADGNGLHYDAGGKCKMPVYDLQLYAEWTSAVYTITFSTNGGSSVSTQSVEHGQTAEEPASPEKSGNTFAGWYLDAELTAAYDFSRTVTSDLTLYAKWTPVGYRVTFESNGGSSVSSQEVEYGKTVTQPQNPTKSGLNFAGWYTDVQCTKLYYFSTPVTADVTLYAKWLEHGHQIIFNTNGGSKVDSQTVADGSVVQRPSDPSKDGYLFASWMDGSNNDYDFTKIVSDSFTLYAKWTNYFSVTMNESKATLIIDNGYSAYSHIVDWGDGQVSNSSTMLTLAHDYEKSGDYTITLTSKRGDATVSAQFHVSALGGSDPVPGGDDDPKDDNTGDKKDYTAVIVFVVLAIVCLLLGCVLKPFWMGTVVFLILAVIAAALISSGVI